MNLTSAWLADSGLGAARLLVQQLLQQIESYYSVADLFRNGGMSRAGSESPIRQIDAISQLLFDAAFDAATQGVGVSPAVIVEIVNTYLLPLMMHYEQK